MIPRGSYGFSIILETQLDLSAATTLTLRLASPDPDAPVQSIDLPIPGSIINAAAGTVNWQVSERQLDVAGMYEVALIVEGDDLHYESGTKRFRVDDAL